MRSLKPRELEKRIRALLKASLSDEALRTDLEELAVNPSFPGFTRLWGPELYLRNPVMFRPFILSHFSRILFWPPFSWRPAKWKGEGEDRLEKWLRKVDERDDIELFRLLYVWKVTAHRSRRSDNSALIGSDLLGRLNRARNAAQRHVVLNKFDFWFILDEPTAVQLYRVDPQAVTPFILRHLPTSEWAGRKRKLWMDLMDEVKKQGDEDLFFRLYRRQVPLGEWRKDALLICSTVPEEELVQALEMRHPKGFGLDLGGTFYELAEKRGQEVIPYIIKHLRQVWPGFWIRGGYDKMLDLAWDREWFDFWATLLRACAHPKEFNREIGRLLADKSLGDDEKVGRLLMLSGVTREWNLPGLGMALVKQLDEKTALRLYELFPALLRGPFKMNISATWGSSYPRLIERLIADDDRELIDFIASRFITRGGDRLKKGQLAEAERLADYYQGLQDDDLEFCRRASAVLNQIPAYAIYDYNGLVRTNRLARMFFERSGAFYLADKGAMMDLVEAAEIHVQTLAYRTLGLDDDRARQCAAENIDILLGTLLRPLHRVTRTLAFGALFNAASTLDNARRVHDRARQALDLPDKRYPKEKLIGLIGGLLYRWPELRDDTEQPTIYGEAAL